MRRKKESRKNPERGEKGMKKICIAMCLAFLSVVFVCSSVYALSGACSGCHTMHNSQDGQDVDGSGPNNLLLKSSCTGCHTSGSAIGPQIDKTTNILAGGSFDTTTIATTSSKRHDVTDLGLSETVNVTGTPGNGGDSVMTVGLAELTCAGSKGCHGKHNVAGSDAGISGSHHAAAGTTYRFLWIGTGASPDAVLGEGDSDYEETVSNSDHNVYSAHATQGISSFCNQCHGEFHGTLATETGGSSSPWKRHPTDYALFTGGAGWNSSSTNLNANDAPIGLIDIGTNTTTSNYYQDGTIDTTNSAVICLSCHRAHGSQYDDLLRFDYSTMNAGGGGTSGCLSCHYAQQ